VPYPPAHILIGIGAGTLARGRLRHWWLVWIVAAAFALLPDVDVAIRGATGAWAPLDRGFTHSLLAVAAVWAGVRLLAGSQWALVAGAAYASHLVADLLQSQRRTSVALFWPLQDDRMAPVAALFPWVPVERGSGMRQAALSLLAPEALTRLLLETAIAAGILLACLLLAALLRRRRAHA
jgi:membrane-bound metal-dependent hydrolase YbcI (DUF457 family)